MRMKTQQEEIGEETRTDYVQKTWSSMQKSNWTPLYLRCETPNLSQEEEEEEEELVPFHDLVASPQVKKL